MSREPRPTMLLLLTVLLLRAAWRDDFRGFCKVGNAYKEEFPATISLFLLMLMLSMERIGGRYEVLCPKAD